MAQKLRKTREGKKTSKTEVKPRPGRRQRPDSRERLRPDPGEEHIEDIPDIEEEDGPPGVEISDPKEEESEPRIGLDREEFLTDPFLESENRLGDYLRPIWIWMGNSILWCWHRPRLKTLYTDRLECFRILIETLVRGLKDISYLHVKSPADAPGFINSSWLGTPKTDSDDQVIGRPRAYLLDNAILIPKAPQPCFPLNLFLATSGPQARPPLWVERRWLKNALKNHKFEQRFAEAKKLDFRRKDLWMWEEFQSYLKGFRKLIKESLKQSGYEVPPEDVYPEIKRVSWNNIVSEWRNWWKNEWRQRGEKHDDPQGM